MSVFAPFGSIFLKFSGMRGTSPQDSPLLPVFFSGRGRASSPKPRMQRRIWEELWESPYGPREVQICSIWINISKIFWNPGDKPPGPPVITRIFQEEGEHPPQSPVCKGVFKGKCGNPHMAPGRSKFARFESIFLKFSSIRGAIPPDPHYHPSFSDKWRASEPPPPRPKAYLGRTVGSSPLQYGPKFALFGSIFI